MSTRRIIQGCGLAVTVLLAASPYLGAQGTGEGALSAAAREAVDRARTKVVVLKTTRRTSHGSGTGFLARPNLVVTARHVVTETTGVLAWVNGVSYRAAVVEEHPQHDLALLRLRAPALQLKPVSMASNSQSLAPMEELVVLAGPSQPAGANGEPVLRYPIPARFTRRLLLTNPDGRRNEMLSMRGSVRRGDSGSPILRASDGTVIGVLSSRELPDPGGVSHTAYGVPVEAIHAWLDAALKREADGDFYLFRFK